MAQAPPNVRVAVFRGTAYERGVAHGQRFANDIRSLYTRLLSNTILPNLNLERSNIAPVLGRYYDPIYDDGDFAYQMLLESGRHLWDEGHIPEEYKQELQGLADGAQLPFDDMLVLNTFMDTMMGFRAVSAFIQSIQKPSITELQMLAPALLTDGVDNDGDGTVDEADEDVVEYDSADRAVLVEVPTDARIRLVLEDETLAGLSCVDAGNVDPLGTRAVERRCVKDACVSPGCESRKLLTRECIGGPESLCLSPNISVDCFHRECVEELDPGCVDAESLRLTIDGSLYRYADASQRGHFQVTRIPPEDDGSDPGPTYPHDRDCQGPVEVIFSPPDGLPPAAQVGVTVQGQDQSQIYVPEPYHPRALRDERFIFTTAGYTAATGAGQTPQSIVNGGASDGVVPTTYSFGARGSATRDGAPLLAHHYMLIDGGLMHEHCLVAVHVPEPGHGTPHVTIGWTGLLWGFSGMNANGLAWTTNNSDTLDSPLVGNVIDEIYANADEILAAPDLSGLAMILVEAQLLATGRPLGFMGRELLAGYDTAEAGLGYLHSVRQTFGWNVLLADAQGGLAGVELDATSQSSFRPGSFEYADRDGFQYYTPDPTQPQNLDPWGRPWASVGPDDLRMGSHYAKNALDMEPIFLFGPFSPRPQRRWTTYYYRSLSTTEVVAEEIAARYGELDVPAAIEVLRRPELIDDQDSMTAAVFEPARAVVHYGLGTVPATKDPFVELDLQALLGSGGAR